MFAVLALQEIEFDVISLTQNWLLFHGIWRLVDCIHFSAGCGWHPRFGRLPVAGYQRGTSQDDRGILQLCGPQIDPYGDDCPILGATNHHPDDEGRVFTIYNLQFTFHSLQTSSLSHDSGNEGGAISEDRESNPDDVHPNSCWITLVGECQRNIDTWSNF